jgi:hypothetical protein
MSEPSNTLFDTSKPPPSSDGRPVIFLDATFSSVRIAEFLSKWERWKVELHSRNFAPDCPDEVWIPEVAKRGWIIITGDKMIRRKPSTASAVKQHNAKVFILGQGGRQLEDYQAILYAVRNKILRAATRTKGALFATITKDAEVRVCGEDRTTAPDRTRRKYHGAYDQWHHQKAKPRRKK